MKCSTIETKEHLRPSSRNWRRAIDTHTHTYKLYTAVVESKLRLKLIETFHLSLTNSSKKATNITFVIADAISQLQKIRFNAQNIDTVLINFAKFLYILFKNVYCTNLPTSNSNYNSSEWT